MTLMHWKRCFVLEKEYVEHTETCVKLMYNFIIQGAHNKTAFPDDVIMAYKYTFSQPGAFTPPLNYYRNMAELENERWEPMNVPTLLIWVS